MNDFTILPDGRVLLPGTELTEIVLTDVPGSGLFAIDLVAGQTVEVLLDLKDPRSTADLGGIDFYNLEFFDPDFEGPKTLDYEVSDWLQDRRPFNPQPQIVIEAPADGRYLIDLGAGSSTGLDESTYVVRVDPLTTISDPQSDYAIPAFIVEPGQSFEGEIHKLDDLDAFFVTLDAGQHIRVEVEGTGVDPLEAFTASVSLGVNQYDEVRSLDETGVLAFTAPSDGSFLFAIEGFATASATSDTVLVDTGSYRVTVEETPEPHLIDVAISDAQILRVPTQDDPTLTVSFTMTNLGPDTAYGASATIFDEGTRINAISTLDLKPGESRQLEWTFQDDPWPPPSTGSEPPLYIPGPLEIIANSFNRIPDLDPTNDSAIAWVLIEDGFGYSQLDGTVGPDRFIMALDGVRDLLRGFEVGRDVIDVSAWGVVSFDQLEITEQTRWDGTVNWISVGPSGSDEVALRFAGDTPFQASALTAEDFVFATEVVRTDVVDPEGFSDLFGTGPTTFVMREDGVRDLIRNFDPGRDLIDVTDLDLAAFDIDDLEITNQTRRDGTVNWINVASKTGQIEFAVRFGDGTELDAASLTADSFVFQIPGPPDFGIGPDRIRDSLGFDDLRGTFRDEIFVLADDDIRDLVRDFEVGEDRLDVSAWGVAGIEDLTIFNQTRWNGSVNWVTISDADGPEVALRFTGDTELDASALDADDFVFA